MAQGLGYALLRGPRDRRRTAATAQRTLESLPAAGRDATSRTWRSSCSSIPTRRARSARRASPSPRSCPLPPPSPTPSPTPRAATIIGRPDHPRSRARRAAWRVRLTCVRLTCERPTAAIAGPSRSGSSSAAASRPSDSRRPRARRRSLGFDEVWVSEDFFFSGGIAAPRSRSGHTTGHGRPRRRLGRRPPPGPARDGARDALTRAPGTARARASAWGCPRGWSRWASCRVRR